jgi:hypothetical protein
MVLRPFTLPDVYFAAVADPEVDYFNLIETFAKKRVKALAGKTIYNMQRIPAPGTFDDTATGLKSVWDEFCWYVQFCENDMEFLSDGMDQTVDGLIQAYVEEVPFEEAVLLTCAASEDHSHLPSRANDDIIAVVRNCVSEAAGQRAMSRFEVW